MDFTNNKGVNIILDINGLLKEKNILSSLSWNGKYLILGFTNNNISSIKTNYILILFLSFKNMQKDKFLSGDKIIILKEIF